MKKSKRILLILAPLLGLVLLFTLVPDLGAGIMEVFGVKDKVPASYFTQVTKKKMQDIFAETQSPYLVVDAYPVKKTPYRYRADVTLALFFRNPSGKIVYTNEPLNEAELATQQEYYRVYMNANNPALTAVPEAFQVLVMRDLIERNNMNIRLSTDDGRTYVSYDTCRIPPGCDPPIETSAQASDEIILSDTCRIPPGCHLPILYSSTTQKIARQVSQ